MRALNPRILLVACGLAFGVFGRADAAGAQSDLDAERAAIVRELTDMRQRVKQLEERLRTLDRQRGQDARNTPVESLNSRACAQVFFLDSSGVKHVRPECASATPAETCEAPFTLDTDGIKRLRPECRH